MPKKDTRSLLVYLSNDKQLNGWLAWIATFDEGGRSGYISRLIEDDRSRAVKEGGETLERYRAYLTATGMSDEAALVGGMIADASEGEQE